MIKTINIILIRNKWPQFYETSLKPVETKSKVFPSSSVMDPFKQYNVECCLELWSISAKVNEKSTLACGHSKIVIQHTQYGGGTQLIAELLLEQIIWSLIDDLNKLDRRTHRLGTPLYLAMAFIKFVYGTKLKNAKCEATLDHLRIEWNTILVDILQEYLQNKTKKLHDAEESDNGWMPKIFSVKLDVTNFNSFFHLKHTGNL